MFQEEYNFFNKTLLCLVRHRSVLFDRETAIYSYIINKFTKLDYNVYRVDTKNQIGFPDMLLLSPTSTLLFEAKMLKKKALISIQDDLGWQQGQIAFMMNAINKQLPYALIVAKNYSIAYIAGEQTICQLKELC